MPGIVLKTDPKALRVLENPLRTLGKILFPNFIGLSKLEDELMNLIIGAVKFEFNAKNAGCTLIPILGIKGDANLQVEVIYSEVDEMEAAKRQEPMFKPCYYQKISLIMQIEKLLQTHLPGKITKSVYILPVEKAVFHFSDDTEPEMEQTTQ